MRDLALLVNHSFLLSIYKQTILPLLLNSCNVSDRDDLIETIYRCYKKFWIKEEKNQLLSLMYKHKRITMFNIFSIESLEELKDISSKLSVIM